MSAIKTGDEIDLIRGQTEKSIAKLRTCATNQDGVTVIDGEAVVKYS